MSKSRKNVNAYATARFLYYDLTPQRKDLFILIISNFKNNIKKSQRVTDDLLSYITDVM